MTMLKRSEGYFRGKNDFELFFQVWQPTKPDATLVITHGLGEHTECYQRLVDGLSAHLNLRFVAWDLRGHGRSEGKRGVSFHFSDYSDDLKIFINYLEKEMEPSPMALLGHSMGGLVNLNAIVDNGNMGLRCLCLSSPLLGVQVEVPKIKKIGAEYLAKYLPTITMWNEIRHNVLTHDKKILEEFDRDPLRHDRVSAKLYLDMVAYTEKVRKSADKITLPIIFQIAGQDRVVSSKATQEFYDSIVSGSKTLKIYENSYHEIFNDIEREIVYKDLAVWLKKNLLG